jgi:hypothetical protein
VFEILILVLCCVFEDVLGVLGVRSLRGAYLIAAVQPRCCRSSVLFFLVGIGCLGLMCSLCAGGQCQFLWL